MALDDVREWFLFFQSGDAGELAWTGLGSLWESFHVSHQSSSRNPSDHVAASEERMFIPEREERRDSVFSILVATAAVVRIVPERTSGSDERTTADSWAL